MSSSLMLIVNPRSGRGLSKSALGAIISELCMADYLVTVYFSHTDRPGTLVDKYAHKHDLVVCVGGDGTLSAVVSALLHNGLSLPVGYIPAGTANDVAHTLALSKNPGDAAKSIIAGEPKPLDIGMFGDKYFTYIAAFGAFTKASYETKQNAKRTFGHFAYLLEGLSGVFTIKPHHVIVEYDDGIIEDDFAFGGVLNSTSMAGIIRLDAKMVNLSDGMFEIFLVKKPIDPLQFLETSASILLQEYNDDNITFLHSSRVRFTFNEEIAWTIDGEDGGKHITADIKNHREAIRIIM